MTTWIKEDQIFKSAANSQRQRRMRFCNFQGLSKLNSSKLILSSQGIAVPPFLLCLTSSYFFSPSIWIFILYLSWRRKYFTRKWCTRPFEKHAVECFSYWWIFTGCFIVFSQFMDHQRDTITAYQIHNCMTFRAKPMQSYTDHYRSTSILVK